MTSLSVVITDLRYEPILNITNPDLYSDFTCKKRFYQVHYKLWTVHWTTKVPYGSLYLHFKISVSLYESYLGDWCPVVFLI